MHILPYVETPAAKKSERLENVLSQIMPNLSEADYGAAAKTFSHTGHISTHLSNVGKGGHSPHRDLRPSVDSRQ